MKSSVIVAINPEKVMRAQKDTELAKMLSAFDYPIIDGAGISFILRLKRKVPQSRLTGIDAMEALVDHSREIHAPLFFYGAKPGVAEKAVECLASRYPGITIAGIADGYQKDENKILDSIRSSGARIVFVALGSPTQERFMYNNRNKLEGCILQGVGGSFDVFSGNKKRAPAFFRKSGFEWLYRLFCEPWRLKRQLVLVKFLLKVVLSKNDILEIK